MLSKQRERERERVEKTEITYNVVLGGFQQQY